MEEGRRKRGRRRRRRNFQCQPVLSCWKNQPHRLIQSWKCDRRWVLRFYGLQPKLPLNRYDFPPCLPSTHLPPSVCNSQLLFFLVFIVRFCLTVSRRIFIESWWSFGRFILGINERENQQKKPPPPPQPPRSHPAATSLPPTGPSPDRPKEWNPVDVVVDVVDMVGILAVPRREMTTGHRCDL